MTVNEEVIALTAEVTALKSRVDGRKNLLTAAAAAATSADALAATSETGTIALRDEIEDLRTDAYNYSLAAGSASPYQDLTAIAESKAVTATDVFVYDTRKDSDGGAWRKRCQGTSWYKETLNTATRGSRREFPTVAVIVASSSGITIYDGDDPALPMWMVFIRSNNYAIHSGPIRNICMLNGILTSATEYGFILVNFLADLSYRLTNTYGGWNEKPSIIGRNSSGGVNTYIPQAIIDQDANDVAMTVLPNAPIDPKTGLPIPTIYVFTSGGVTRIAHDGTVSSTATGQKVQMGTISGDIVLAAIQSSGKTRVRYRSKFATLPSGGASGLAAYWGSGTQLVFNVNSQPSGIADSNYADNLNGLVRTAIDTTTGEDLSTLITSSYNTGWMNGDIKLATLSDTTPGVIAGDNELVTNGTFDVDTSGWTNESGNTIEYDNGTALITRKIGNTEVISLQVLSGLTVGSVYIISMDVTDVNASGWPVAIYNGSTILAQRSTVGSVSAIVKATSNTINLYLRIRGVSPTSVDYTANVDNISIKEVVADRSINNNGLNVIGNITKTPVATGADLMAYSGFSASNYLEQPYNPDLDFGTGDFCEIVWVRKEADNLRYLSSWGSIATESRRSLYVYTDGKVYWNLNEYGSLSASAVSEYLALNVWSMVVGVKQGDTAYLYVNGNLEDSVNVVGINLVNTNAVQRVGISYTNTSPMTQNKVSLYRVSATAPSAEQIKKMYEDEKVLFQEGAKATLYGTSDAVTALAYDDDTNLLHVGTSNGRSVFDGLRRVSHTTTAVGSAISASGGLVVEE